MTKPSATLGGIGSVATSAVPILAKVSFTSGNSRNFFCTAFCISIACVRLVPGMRSECTARSPSSRFGMNSLPMREARRRLSTTRTAAPVATSPRLAMAERKQRCVKRLRAAHEEVFFLGDFPAHENGDGRGHESDREDHRAGEREQNGPRHRVKHFPFHAGEGEDRQIDDHDDEDAEEARLHDFAGRLKDSVETFRRGWRVARVDVALPPAAGCNFPR